MAITKWSIQVPRPKKAPPSVSGPKTISNVLAEERPFLSARIGIAMPKSNGDNLYLLLKKKMSGQERTTRIHSRNPSTPG